MNKKIYFFLLPLLFFYLYTFAQEKQPYFQLEPHITSRDYQPGVMLLKLKPEYKSALTATNSRTKAVSKLKQILGVREVRPVIPPKSSVKARQQRQKPATIDVTAMQVIYFNPEVPIEEAVNQMYETGMVYYAEPAYVYKTHYVPDDPLVSRQYYHEVIRSYDAWNITRSSEDIVIGIVDSGIDPNHPDLIDKKAINEDEIPDNGIDDDEDGYIDNVWGWDFIGDDINSGEQDNDPSEDEEEGTSHGTLVAGCAVAEADNGTGIAGVGFNAKFLVTKHSYAGDTANSIYAGYQGIAYMADQQVDIINLSFGGPGRSQFVQDLIDYAVLDQGCLVVASAGNDGTEAANYPAAYHHVLSVAATDADDLKAGFSNTGYTVDLSAPGTGILTTAIGGNYLTVQGTSFASPIVAGAAALVKAVYPEMSGLQIGEILRVTADSSLYQQANNPQNQLGKGRLDIVNALTQQFPSIRIQNSMIANTDGNTPQEGDTVVVSADFVNYLWPSSGALTATMTTFNSYVQILQNQVQLGSIVMGDSASNETSPFRFVISEDTPENTSIDLLITYNDGDYTDYEYISILVNPSYLNIQENRIATSISSRGRIGYQDNSLDERAEGLGFIFEETNLLFEMGLMLGTSADQLSDAVRSEPDQNPENDFRSLEKIRRQQPGRYAYSEVIGSFDDSGARSASSHVTVGFRSMVWIEDPDDNYVIVQYTIHNDGEDSLKNFYAGLYADWDIGAGGGEDRADWDSINNLGYVYSAPEEARLFAGLQELSGRPNYFAIDNDNNIENSPFGVYDGFSNEEKFRSLSEGIGREQAGFSTDSGNDVSHTVASGPYEIAPGDSIRIAFALHGALSMEELLTSAAAAQDQYDDIFQVSEPIAEAVSVCYGDSVILQASGGNSYRWYASKSGGEPLSTASGFQTGAITKDTVFFVANVEDTLESVRTEVPVTLALDATIQVEDGTSLCGTQTVELSVAQADAYLWSTGEITRSITINEAGDYFVQVQNDSLRCVAVSDTITIQQFEEPVADFQVELAQGGVYERQNVQFTDQSEGEVTHWFWDFGDDSTSTVQNPEHIYEEAGAYEVKLTVTNADGCSSTVIQTLDVVTDVEDAQTANHAKLVPNPASGQVTLQLKTALAPATLTLIDAKGRIVKSMQFQQPVHEVKINLAGLAPGAYLIQWVGEEKTYVRRLLVAPK